MTEEEKKAAEIAAAQKKADAERANETPEEKTAREAEEREEALKREHEAELALERKRREITEKAAADLAFKLREERRQKAGENEDDDKPLTVGQLQGALALERELTRKELQSGLIAEKVRKLARNETEANLIIEIHKNRSFPEGLSLDEQIEEAFVIANRKSIIAQNEELRRALRGKENVSDNSAGTHRDSLPLEEPRISSNDVQALKAAGFAWDGKSGLYVKTLKGGKKIMTYNPKTKARQVIEK